ncbi:MAG: GNAT family protein [Alphaproteobacteria bacterium]
MKQSLPRKLELTSGNLLLRAPRNGDFLEWCALRTNNRAFLSPWEPTWPADDLSRRGWRRRLAGYERERRDGTALALFIYTLEGLTGRQELAGGVRLSNINYGVQQSASIGYWLGRDYGGAGNMSKAVEMVCRFGFEQIGLHRIEACCIPDNQRSARVLKRCGFEQEGLARDYLKINGKWHDHLLFARLNDL